MTIQAYVDRTNVQNEITAKIVAQLEAGVRPWSKSWKSGQSGNVGGSFVLPRRANGEAYSGINILLCWSAMEANGWTNKTFMTFDQAKKLGGCVMKGSKATKVVYYSTFTKEDDSGEEQTIPFMKLYSVFNAEQISGLPAEYYENAVIVADSSENNAYADKFFRSLGISLRHGGDKAFYSPSSDFVAMPVFGAFNTPADYYSTLGHEMTHATGHSSRCDRTFGKRFGDNAYSFEELVAELGAAFLCAELGISNEPREDHASYLATWIKVLRADSKAIFTAASLASKAVAWMRENQGVAAMGVDPISEPAPIAEPIAAVEPAKAVVVQLPKSAPAPSSLTVKVKLNKRDNRVGNFVVSWADGTRTKVTGVLWRDDRQMWAAAYQAADRLRRCRARHTMKGLTNKARWMVRGAAGIKQLSAAYWEAVYAYPMAEAVLIERDGSQDSYRVTDSERLAA